MHSSYIKLSILQWRQTRRLSDSPGLKSDWDVRSGVAKQGLDWVVFISYHEQSFQPDLLLLLLHRRSRDDEMVVLKCESLK